MATGRDQVDGPHAHEVRQAAEDEDGRRVAELLGGKDCARLSGGEPPLVPEDRQRSRVVGKREHRQKLGGREQEPPGLIPHGLFQDSQLDGLDLAVDLLG